MSIPDFQSIMLPMLKTADNEKVYSLGDMRHILAEKFGLTEDERSALLPSGRQPIFANRVAWSKVYLCQAGLLASPRRGFLQITQRGLEVLQEKPQRIDVKFLYRFPEFVGFRTSGKKNHTETISPVSSNQEPETPEEALEAAYQSLRMALATELLTYVKAASSQFFEGLVVELLIAMGYGGSRKEAGEAIGKSGDEGIDGIINEDRLGLDVIYLQAKKWEGTVGRPELQRFVGALQGKHARKGVFITTGSFSSEAISYASQIDPKIVIIDGRHLAEFMIDFNVGVTTSATYQLKCIDTDYFEEE
ncbi:MAG: restriction endonuclease [bacterium]